MARLEEQIWEPDLTGPTRRDRRPCRYFVYRPDQLTGRRFAFDGDVAADVADDALVKLNAVVDALADTEALARLLRADAARRMGEEVRDVTAAEVLANIDAMVWGVAAVEPGD